MTCYLDHNATCPMLNVSLEAMQQAATEAFGNPSSLHWAGRAARKVLDDARDAVAKFVDAESGSVVFTSGGTEANNMAIHGWLATQQPGSVVVSAIEHPSVLQPLEQWHDRDGWNVIKVRPGRDGAVSAQAVIEAIREDTRMVCLMAANNETGVLQPAGEVVKYCRGQGIATLVDAVQLLGKGAVSVREIDADFVSFSAHKIGGPKGVGALVVRRGIRLEPHLQGGGQERKRRSGTENVPGVAGFAAALGKMDYQGCAAIRDAFEVALKAAIPEVTVYGEAAGRVANTSMFSLPGMDGETLLMQLDLAGFAVASGSACSSGKREPSHVLLVMGVQESVARSSLRVSFGPANSREDAQGLVHALADIYTKLRKMAGIAA